MSTDPMVLSIFDIIFLISGLSGLIGFFISLFILLFKKNQIRELGLQVFPERSRVIFYAIPSMWNLDVACACTRQALGLSKNKAIYYAYKHEFSIFWLFVMFFHAVSFSLSSLLLLYVFIIHLLPNSKEILADFSLTNPGTGMTLGVVIILIGAYRSWRRNNPDVQLGRGKRNKRRKRARKLNDKL